MPGESTSYRANYDILGRGNTPTQSLQSLGDLFGVTTGRGGRVNDEVRHLLLGGEVVHNPGNAWCTRVIDCHAMDILLRLAQKVMEVIHHKV